MITDNIEINNWHKYFDKVDHYKMRDCLDILLKNLVIQNGECSEDVTDNLSIQNKLQIGFALKELVRIIGNESCEDICPGYKEKCEANIAKCNLGIYGYFRMRRSVMNYRPVEGVQPF